MTLINEIMPIYKVPIYLLILLAKWQNFKKRIRMPILFV